MGVAGSVCYQLCHQTVEMSTKGSVKTRGGHFEHNVKVKAQTLNKCCLMDCIAELRIYSACVSFTGL